MNNNTITIERTYAIPSPITIVGGPALLLRDSASYLKLKNQEAALQLERQFDDLYHLFMAKIARLPLQTLSMAQEGRLVELFDQVLKLKRQIGE